MSDAVPTSIPADGSLLVLWVPTIADLSAPTLAELTDASVIDLTCYLTADGWSPTTSEDVSNDNRLCSRQNFELPGRSTEGLDLTYVYQAQDLAATDNKAYSTLLYKTQGNVVARWGADYEVPVATDDEVDIYPGTCGIQKKQPPAANERLKVMQKIFIRDLLRRSVTVVAS